MEEEEMTIIFGSAVAPRSEVSVHERVDQMLNVVHDKKRCPPLNACCGLSKGDRWVHDSLIRVYDDHIALLRILMHGALDRINGEGSS